MRWGAFRSPLGWAINGEYAVVARLQALQGWRRRGALFGFGAVATLAFAPFHLFPAVIIAFSGLLIILSGARRGWQAFGDGWWFAFGHHVTGLYWIAISLLTDPVKFGWLIPFSVSGIPAALGVYAGLATWAANRFRLRGVGLAVGLGAAWWLMEWLRTQLFSGFPWNLVGYVWGFSEATLQLASIGGVWLLTLLALWVALLPGAALLVHGAARWRILAATLVIFIMVAGFGMVRLAVMNARTEGGGTRLRVVQANIPQDLKWDDALENRHLTKHIAMSQVPDGPTPEVILWPESAIPFSVYDGAPVLARLADALQAGQVLISGAVRITPPGQEPFQAWNSAIAVDARGALLTAYDKVRLVPFGEFVPLREVLPIEKITPGGMDFSRGPGPQTLTVPGAPPFGVLICYEAIFPNAVVDHTNRPQWLVNVTNDAWFGKSLGPYQHLAMAQMRAVEAGLPLVRAANTGVSAVIDAYGRILAHLPLEGEGVLNAPLPAALPATFFSRYEFYMTLFIVFLTFAMFLIVAKHAAGHSK